MHFKLINELVWYVPIKKLRNTAIELLILHFKKFYPIKNNQFKSISLYNYKNIFNYNKYNNYKPFNNIINHYKNKLLLDN
ncbi:hypothetical protein BRSU_1576 [Brachyspira suanatina]|uniref:Uncharacterized protein n=1 Tax=Brachyspira suanatina TaxID=381802 RepID=A0A0G4K8C7_9SPIR|nr:hypothetical protein [Brachyspira suanatina]CRF33645.1 hypothetical protein BRSU_1576 [Brachyspira suanatina]